MRNHQKRQSTFIQWISWAEFCWALIVVTIFIYLHSYIIVTLIHSNQLDCFWDIQFQKHVNRLHFCRDVEQFVYVWIFLRTFQKKKNIKLYSSFSWKIDFDAERVNVWSKEKIILFCNFWSNFLSLSTTDYELLLQKRESEKNKTRWHQKTGKSKNKTKQNFA